MDSWEDQCNSANETNKAAKVDFAAAAPSVKEPDQPQEEAPVATSTKWMGSFLQAGDKDCADLAKACVDLARDLAQRAKNDEVLQKFAGLVAHRLLQELLLLRTSGETSLEASGGGVETLNEKEMSLPVEVLCLYSGEVLATFLYARDAATLFTDPESKQAFTLAVKGKYGKQRNSRVYNKLFWRFKGQLAAPTPVQLSDGEKVTDLVSAATENASTKTNFEDCHDSPITTKIEKPCLTAGGVLHNLSSANGTAKAATSSTQKQTPFSHALQGIDSSSYGNFLWSYPGINALTPPILILNRRHGTSAPPRWIEATNWGNTSIHPVVTSLCEGTNVPDVPKSSNEETSLSSSKTLSGNKRKSDEGIKVPNDKKHPRCSDYMVV